VNNAEGLFLTLRRALQLIGAALALDGRVGGSSSVLASGVLSRDTPSASPGVLPRPHVRLSPAVNLEGDAVHHGLPERCVALESLDFLLDAMGRLRGRIEALLPPAQSTSAVHFFTRAAQCVAQLKGLMYHSNIVRTLPECGALPGMITAVAW